MPDVTVKGRKAYIVCGYSVKKNKPVWAIFDRSPGNEGEWLSVDGDWTNRGKQFQADSEPAAEQFLREHADPPAASPDCRCRRCLDDDWEPGVDEHPIPPSRRYMVVCQTCGNKRCPHAEWHGYRCTGSNEPEQVPQPAVTINNPLADLIFRKCGLTQQQAVRVAEVLLGEGEWSWPKSKIDAVAEATRVYSLHLKEKDAALTARDDEVRRLRDLLRRSKPYLVSYIADGKAALEEAQDQDGEADCRPIVEAVNEVVELSGEIDAALASPPPPRTAFQAAADIEAETPIAMLTPEAEWMLDEIDRRLKPLMALAKTTDFCEGKKYAYLDIAGLLESRKAEPPRTYVGDGKPLPPGVWLHRLSNGAAEGPYIGLQHKGVPGKVYTFVGHVPEEEGK